MKIIEMSIRDYEAVLDLMRQTPGVTARDADSRESTHRYLERNPGFSFIARDDQDKVIGCAMCGHDGRRGYLQHVVVRPEYRGRGIAGALISRCLDKLQSIGIVKTHIDVLVANDTANRYWTRRGWKRRDDIYRYSFNRSGNPNA